MRFEETLKAMRTGAIAKRGDIGDVYICYNPTTGYFHIWENKNFGKAIELSTKDVLAEDWRIYSVCINMGNDIDKTPDDIPENERQYEFIEISTNNSSTLLELIGGQEERLNRLESTFNDLMYYFRELQDKGLIKWDLK